MKRYQVEVYFNASQVIEVEAENASEAVNKAFLEVNDPDIFEVDGYEIECLDDEDEDEDEDD